MKLTMEVQFLLCTVIVNSYILLQNHFITIAFCNFNHCISE